MHVGDQILHILHQVASFAMRRRERIQKRRHPLAQVLYVVEEEPLPEGTERVWLLALCVEW